MNMYGDLENHQSGVSERTDNFMIPFLADSAELLTMLSKMK